MKEEENIATYLLQVDGIVNTIRGICEKLDESLIVQKVLRLLPLRFDSKVYTLEERKDLDCLTIDELNGVLTAYEMRIGNENPSIREATFKISKVTKNKKHQYYES